MELHFALLSIGALFLVGLIADLLGRQTHVPRVTLLMLVGCCSALRRWTCCPPNWSIGTSSSPRRR